jgi:hypothetical protein
MFDTILAQEPALRLSAFLSVLVGMAVWELAAPCRRQAIRRDLWLDRMLMQPLRGPASGGALDSRKDTQ